MLMEMLGAKVAGPDLRLVRSDGTASPQAENSEESVKKPRLRPLERRRLAASS
jgi:hypothetical protein